MIQTTEDDLEKAGGLQKEVLPELPAVTHLVENEINVDLTQDVDTIRLKVRRPNFWKFKGDYSFQFTQNYYSENWYQGGDNNYTMLALATMEANCNNRTEYKDYVFRNRINNDNTSFRVGLTYNFGKQKAKKADINISNNETNRLPDIKK